MGNMIGARCHDYPAGPPAELFKQVRCDGFDCIQLAPKKALAGVGTTAYFADALLEETQRALEENALQVAVYGSYVELSMFDEAQRRDAVQEFCACLPLARRLAAGCVGSETTQMEKQPGVTREQALRCLKRSLEEILPLAQELGVQVAIEPVYTHAMNTPQAVKEVLRDMASPNLWVIFDPVNLLAPEFIGCQHTLWNQAMECFGDRIAAVHMKGVKAVGGGPQVQMVSCSFAGSVVDYEAVAALLRQVGSRAPILREELSPSAAREDAAFLRQIFG